MKRHKNNGGQSHDGRVRHGHVAIQAVLAGLLAGSLALATTGCAQQDGTVTETPSSSGDGAAQGASSAGSASDDLLLTEAQIPTDGGPLSLIDTGDIWSKRDLDPSYDASEATTISIDGADASISGTGESSVTMSDGTLTISGEGTYVLSGKSDSISVLIDAPEDAKVQLVLAGLNLSCDGSACVYARSADKLFVTVQDGSKNSFSSTGDSPTDDDEKIDGAIFSKCDLTINGAGSLSVSSEHGHGVVGKDEVTLVSSDTTIEAPEGHAIDANDSIAIRDGNWVLAGGTDGLHAEHPDDQSKGWIYVADGSISVTAGTDGIDSGSRIQIDGGNISLDCGDDGIHAEFDLAINGGNIDVTKCVEGIEGGTVTVTAGVVDVVASDDGINATGTPDDSGSKVDGEMPGHDGFEGWGNGDDTGANDDGTSGDSGAMEPPSKPDGMPSFDGGEMPDGTTPPDMPEGMEPPEGFGDGRSGFQGGRPQGNKPQDKRSGESQDGDQGETASDTNSPATEQGESDRPGGFGGMPGGMGGFGSDDTAILTISGGNVTIDAYGDGIDSNGTIHVTGGETYVYGPVSDGDSAMDYGTDMRIDGGTLVAVGSSGMAEDVSEDSKQASATVFLESDATGDVSVSNGTTEIAKCSPTKTYSMVFVSTPSMATDGTYEVRTGDATTSVKMSGTVTVSGTRTSFMGGDPKSKGFGGADGDGETNDGFSSPEELVGQVMGNRPGRQTEVTEA